MEWRKNEIFETINNSNIEDVVKMRRENNENVDIILMNISKKTHLFFFGSPISYKIDFSYLGLCSIVLYACTISTLL